MLAKLITYGETREEAIEIMINAIDNYLVEGVQTTAFGEYVMEHDALDLKFRYHFVKSITMRHHYKRKWSRPKLLL
jgi:acetyl/propionyl-CoA carboxylase alpha subunit